MALGRGTIPSRDSSGGSTWDDRLIVAAVTLCSLTSIVFARRGFEPAADQLLVGVVSPNSDDLFDPADPEPFTGQAYEVAVNYLIYGMAH
jgi:hypothetical protein